VKLILQYWRTARLHGHKATPVWAVVHESGSTGPEGTIATWTLTKRRANIEANRINERVCGIQGRAVIVRIAPNEEGAL
jgi:hypothetical protein